MIARPTGFDNSESIIVEDPILKGKEDMNRRYKAVCAHSHILRIRGKEIRAKLEDLKFVMEIKSGAFGNVSTYSYNGELMAVKEMSRSTLPDKWKVLIMDLEIATKTFNCPHIVQTYGGFFITEDKAKVCMENMDMCLSRLLEWTKHAPVPERIIREIAISVLVALDYLKEAHKLIHRDIKPSNILVGVTGIVKLCDFGMSGVLIQSRVISQQAGCYQYMSPERIALISTNSRFTRFRSVKKWATETESDCSGTSNCSMTDRDVHNFDDVTKTVVFSICLGRELWMCKSFAIDSGDASSVASPSSTMENESNKQERVIYDGNKPSLTDLKNL